MSTPRAIAELMIALAAPRPGDAICDPTAGDCELLAAAAEYLNAHFPAMARDPQELAFFRERTFHAYGADETCAGAERLRALGVDTGRLAAADLLDPRLDADGSRFTLVLARLPGGGRREYRDAPKALLRTVRTKRLELLCLARVLERLALGGRAVVIVPGHLLSGATKAHQRLRSLLVEAQKVEAVIALPSSAFAPQPSEPASILVFARTDRGSTEAVWFCDADAIGMDGRNAEAGGGEEGATPASAATGAGAQSGFAEVLARWRSLVTAPAPSPELARERDAASFCVPKAEIAAQGYDLGVGRYRLPAPARIETRRPQEILAELAGLEAEIFQGMKELVGMLK